MPIYVALWSTRTITGVFNAKADAKKINELLGWLQQNGAKIINVKVSLGGERDHITAVYLVLYEAEKPLL